MLDSIKLRSFDEMPLITRQNRAPNRKMLARTARLTTTDTKRWQSRWNHSRCGMFLLETWYLLDGTPHAVSAPRTILLIQYFLKKPNGPHCERQQNRNRNKNEMHRKSNVNSAKWKFVYQTSSNSHTGAYITDHTKICFMLQQARTPTCEHNNGNEYSWNVFPVTHQHAVTIEHFWPEPTGHTLHGWKPDFRHCADIAKAHKAIVLTSAWIMLRDHHQQQLLATYYSVARCLARSPFISISIQRAS